MFLQPISNCPALYIPDLNMLVIADLHIGIENELREYGVHASSQIKILENTILTLIKKYKPTALTILGDVKHTIPSTPYHEKKELYQFLENIQTNTEIIIVPGNHDGSIKSMIPEKIQLESSDGYKNGSIGFLHGHRWPKKEIMQGDYLFCGHTHPTIRFTDKLGYHYYESCWVKGKINSTNAIEKYAEINPELTILFFPAFNPLCGGIAVNEEGIFGPLKHLIDIKQSSFYLLDGSLIGNRIE
jgi:uncharacterized protein